MKASLVIVNPQSGRAKIHRLKNLNDEKKLAQNFIKNFREIREKLTSSEK